jgi:hypothetical protein
VVRKNRLPQVVRSPDVPPTELMQLARMLARVLISAMGALVPAGTPSPGAVPVDVLANSPARLKAEARLAESMAEEPMAVGEVVNGAKG